MRFTQRKRRNPPAVIIVSLIDVLIVVLIFLMVTTTFKNQPAFKITLPKTKQSTKTSSAAHPIIVTVTTNSPYFWMGKDPITLEQLQTELTRRANDNPELTLAIRSDTDASLGHFLNVYDAATSARIAPDHIVTFSQKAIQP